MKENKIYDLEERTEQFSLAARDFCIKVKKDIINIEYIKQLVRSAGSVGANYIETNDNVGLKDQVMKLKICKREAKESRYWLKHILTYDDKEQELIRLTLLKEAEELMLIFAAILRKLG